jgi:hypothetical protein
MYSIASEAKKRKIYMFVHAVHISPLKIYISICNVVYLDHWVPLNVQYYLRGQKKREIEDKKAKNIHVCSCSSYHAPKNIFFNI